MVGELVKEGGIELLLPVLPLPILRPGQRGEGTVIEVDIPPHLVVAVFSQNIEGFPGKCRVGQRLGQEGDAAVERPVEIRG